jgi:Cu/Ag efflux pump CusA
VLELLNCSCKYRLGEVYQYILHPKKVRKNMSKELRTMQDWIVRRQLNGTPGVAESTVLEES